VLSLAASGIILGFAAGISPGPLLILVITETITHNTKSGIKTAMVPLITDTPIIILTLLLLVQLRDFSLFFGMLSIAGGCYILKMAYQGFRAKKFETALENKASKGLQKGFFVNMLSPHPWIFWISIGSPIILKASQQGYTAAGIFILFFYVFIIGSKIMIALLVGKFKKNFDRYYILIQRILAGILLIFSGLFFYEGFNFLITLYGQ